MRKTQQTLWLAGFTGVSTACIFSFMISGIHSIERPFAPQPDALLAANSDKNQLVTLHEVRQMLDGNFAKLDIDKDGMINPDEYAGRHISLFLAIDSDSNRKLSPAEIRVHNMRGHDVKRDNATHSIFDKTTHNN